VTQAVSEYIVMLFLFCSSTRRSAKPKPTRNRSSLGKARTPRSSKAVVCEFVILTTFAVSEWDFCYYWN